MDINIILPEPHGKQLEVLQSTAKRKVCLCGRRSGKSILAQIISIQKLLAKEAVAYITPTFDLGKKFFNDICSLLPEKIIQSANKSDLELVLITGGKLKFFSGESLDRMRGYQFNIILCDEAAYIPDLKTKWYESCLPTLTDTNGDAIFFSTPRGKEFVYSLFTKGINKEHGFESFRFDSYSNPHLDKSVIDSIRDAIPEMVFRQEYLAIPGENANNPFGVDNINRNIITTLSNKQPIIYGIDLAKSHDFTVITGLDENGHTCFFERFQQPWNLTIERIKQLPRNINKIVDATGVGDVIVEQLQQVASQIIPFKFTNESKNNIIYQLIRDIENGNVRYNQITADELHVFEYSYSNNGTLRFNAQSGFHDDCVISLALANSYRAKAISNKNWKLYYL